MTHPNKKLSSKGIPLTRILSDSGGTLRRLFCGTSSEEEGLKRVRFTGGSYCPLFVKCFNFFRLGGLESGNICVIGIPLLDNFVLTLVTTSL
ncbi:hypothetical protein Y032_0482g2283 [Ancylostoma ceylanicum]|uniref:Uncharacterized protein n=1 Tax=Ancylostoma ceylanicum TaxID=53326 RepID=A0A016WXI7_9BILA|nr:hypothetical protein Y032_0482g2283 [Ancylostoma ceylanicum]